MSGQQPVLPDAKVSEHVFLGLSWAGGAISFIFLLVRIFIRIRSFHKLYADDYLAIAAWAMFLSTLILWSIEAPALYLEYGVMSGRIILTSPLSELDFIKRYTAFLRAVPAFNILFYSCLWSVKLSFLAFFRRLGSQVTGHKIWWWTVLVITVGTWIACVADIQWNCTLKSWAYIQANCTNSKNVHYSFRTFIANCVADVVTDILIITIPVRLLWRVHIPIRRKVILFAIFSATIVIMVFAIVRVGVVANTHANADISWLYFWSNIEMSVAIPIACVASFRQLYNQSQNQPHGSGSSTEKSSRFGFLSYFRSWGRTTDSSSSHSKWVSSRGRSKDQIPMERPHTGDSQTQFVPLDSIRVNHSFDVSNTSKSIQSQEYALGNHGFGGNGNSAMLKGQYERMYP